MATVTTTIGTGETITTIAAWAALLDDDPTYDSGDDAVGELLDEEFSETPTMSLGSTIGLNSIKLTAQAGAEHDGTYTGARITAAAHHITTWTNLNVICIMTNIAILNTKTNGNRCVSINGTDTGSYFSRLVLGAQATSGGQPILNIGSSTAEFDLNNSFIFGSADRGIGSKNTESISVENCTVFNSGGIGFETGTNWTVKNCISMLNGGNDFDTGGTQDYNMSEDTTAVGSNSLTEETPGDTVVSTTPDSEDLHLKSGSNAIDVGIDLESGGPTDINIDIDQEDRTTVTTWDMGAHEFELPVGGSVTVTHTTDSLLKKLQSLTQTTDSLLKQLLSKTHTTDALLKLQSIITHTSDSLLKKLQTISQTTDALLKKTQTTVHTSDSLLKLQTLLTHTTDSFLSSAAVITLTHTTDSLFKKALLVTQTTDSLLKKLQTASHTTDTFLVLRQLLTHTVDSLLKKTQSLTNTSDSLLKKTQQLVNTSDSLLYLQSLINHTTDAFLVLRQLLTQTTDALLKKTLQSAHTTDSFLSDGTPVASSKVSGDSIGLLQVSGDSVSLIKVTGESVAE